ncbi:unnamed protein product [Triticum turgidum subsp. durum]|uniref:Sucrose:fructan 6-fructosyltransferase n=1 Tax=Triticum turgidum subsp. durum TaxID=4567 RepID=A0A9R0SRA8_TRITD|nr:unnamed protein product [Triticum turgidum subsp. durum]
MLYTGATNVSTVEVQCVAVPEDPNDPLLRRWTKHPANPVLSSPPWISTNDFRDPTSAWYDGSDHTWRTVLGSKDDHNGHHAGIAFMYKTKDFLHYELVPGILHRVENTGEWECIDFYPVGGGDNSSEVLYVLKASMDDERHDYYSLGRFDAVANTWTPVDPEADLGIGLRYDWGKLYASSSFYDPVKRRRIMMGYVGEVDSAQADVAKGWASIQSVPRTVALDEKTRTNLLLWPVEEIETLRLNATELSDITIETGSVFHVPLRQADQLDGALQTSFCQDESRSSRARDVTKRVVGSTVPVLDGEALSIRVLVDHSIVQSFAMGGRCTVTSRVYPMEAIYEAAGVYLFNNATNSSVMAERLVVHEMDSAPNEIITDDKYLHFE